MLTPIVIKELIKYIDAEKRLDELEWDIRNQCPAVIDGLFSPMCDARCKGCQFNVKEIQNKL